MSVFCTQIAMRMFCVAPIACVKDTLSERFVVSPLALMKPSSVSHRVVHGHESFSSLIPVCHLSTAEDLPGRFATS